MGVVRLELTVKDEDAEAVASELAGLYCGPVQDSLYSWSGASVAILGDDGEFRVGARLRIMGRGVLDGTWETPQVTAAPTAEPSPGSDSPARS